LGRGTSWRGVGDVCFIGDCGRRLEVNMTMVLGKESGMFL